MKKNAYNCPLLGLGTSDLVPTIASTGPIMSSRVMRALFSYFIHCYIPNLKDSFKSHSSIKGLIRQSRHGGLCLGRLEQHCMESLTRTRLSLTKSFFAFISSALKQATYYAYCKTFGSTKTHCLTRPQCCRPRDNIKGLCFPAWEAHHAIHIPLDHTQTHHCSTTTTTTYHHRR